MATYLLVNIVFILAIVMGFRIMRVGRTQLITLAVLIIFTVVFDSLIVGLSIVGYDQAKILGIYIGNAPIEDFFYAILAALIVPFIWRILGKHDADN